MTDVLNRIHEFQKFGSILGLERMDMLLDLLGEPQKNLPVIHVAGTNGKGSVCRYIYEALQANGYRTGLYTSPFLEVFNERIEFDGQQISDEDLEVCSEEVLAKAEEMVDSGHDSPTEFEVVTAIAAVYFSKMSPDFVILEVGLGGRGDSTNITDKPLISVITSISYDHMDRLGNTLEEIAYDKAGIIKSGVPVVSNVEPAEAAKVIAREAYKKDCILYDVSRSKPLQMEFTPQGSCFSAMIQGTDYSDVEISMVGEHQVDNALTALTAIEILRKNGIISVEREKLYRGMKRAYQHGRFEIFGSDPVYILDGAHNKEGMAALVKAVDDVFPGKKALTIIGMLSNKAVDDMLDMAIYLGDDFIAAEPDNPLKTPADEIRQKLEKRGKSCEARPCPRDAVSLAEEKKENYDIIVCAGSLYLIGEIRRMIKDEKKGEGTAVL